MITGTARSSTQAGFTLVELLVAVGVLSLVALTAMPLLRGPPAAAQVAADATQLAAALRVTRAAAMSSQEEVALSINSSARSYTSPLIATTFLSPYTDVSLTIGPQERSISGGRVRFFPSGRSTGGEVLLRVRQAEARIRINWATGRVDVVR